MSHRPGKPNKDSTDQGKRSRPRLKTKSTKATAASGWCGRRVVCPLPAEGAIQWPHYSVAVSEESAEVNIEQKGWSAYTGTFRQSRHDRAQCVQETNKTSALLTMFLRAGLWSEWGNREQCIETDGFHVFFRLCSLAQTEGTGHASDARLHCRITSTILTWKFMGNLSEAVLLHSFRKWEGLVLKKGLWRFLSTCNFCYNSI